MRMSDWSSDVCSSDLLGEAGLYGALAGELGVPVILGSGDDVFIAETRPLFPQALWVQTKVAHGQGSGATLSPAAARKAIATAAETAVRGAAEAVPLHIAAPIECRSEEHTSELQSLMRISYAVSSLKKKHTR